MHTQNINTVFWGKLSHNGTDVEYLPLREHCLDVAYVFAALAKQPVFKQRLDAAAGLALTPTHLARLAVFALLHDLGKVNLGFQAQSHSGTKIGHIKPLQALFGEPDLGQSLGALLGELRNWSADPETITAYLLATWSHHGRPVQFDSAIRTGYRHSWWQPQGALDPFAGIAELLEAARTAFPLAFDSTVSPLPHSPALQHRFAGLVMLADWLGSHQSFFPLQRSVSFNAKDVAQKVVTAVGLNAVPAQTDLAARPLPFEARFGFSPHPLQEAIVALPTTDTKQRLLIIEAETGSGKTEVALTRFFDLFAAKEVGGLYFALPTRVAARELYHRVLAALQRVFPNPQLRPQVVLAVPKYARIDDIPVTDLLPNAEVRWDEDIKQSAEHIWAAEHPKRFLAATIAIGTIDQALLSTVQTRHAHLRSVCLDRHLLVVDEVHASDPYMRYLLRSLLAHHVGVVGSHALLLSATLGAAARSEFLAAATGKRGKVAVPSLSAAIETPYPAFTNLTALPNGTPTTDAQGKQVQFILHPTMEQPELLLPELIAALAAGARVLVVLNTVGRAIALQRAVEAATDIPPAALFQCAETICPHHGRFAPTDRKHLDRAVSARLGKTSAPGPLLLIGTQTLEQSLDIDADLLITDLCPADVLLQRVGRLHRHKREPRPSKYTVPRCLVLVPQHGSLETLLDAKGTPSRTAKALGLGSVYADMRALELTRQMLTQTPVINIPVDNRRLVEGATHPECLATLSGKSWQNHGQTVAGVNLAQQLAGQYAIMQFGKSFTEQVAFCDVADKPQARTRLGLDTLRLRLPQALPGPFGYLIDEICIPGHLAPKNLQDASLTVVSHTSEQVSLRVDEQTYCYSRFGLERTDESIT